MEKKDLMYLVAALVLVLIIALVIKPLATGQPVKTGISGPTTTTFPATSLPDEQSYPIPVITSYIVTSLPPTSNPSFP